MLMTQEHPLIAHPDGIFAIDAGYVRPQMAAIHFIVQDGHVAIVDTATNASLGAVLGALDQLGLSPAAVDYVILTHVHLDHAGGAGSFMANMPNAKLVVHPRGARHMADPSKLFAGVSVVYGAEEAQRLYGTLLPVPAERIVDATDGLELDLAGRKLVCLDTPGHARHHICIWDSKARAFFTGDTFGLSYRELDVDGHPFAIPTTTPVQFEPEALHASIDRMMSYQPQAMYLTHFSRVTEAERLAGDLHRLIEAYVAVARAARGQGEERHREIRAGLQQIMRDESARQGWPGDDATLMELLATDIELNAQGLGIWMDNQSPAGS